ncbi:MULTISPECIES: tetratricopeptide repeat protein [Paraburkholderia]|uniref:tetratricopeptide repeat protein n=1 Tax=Paraburkholderia TaxID=1822464 RepID=UPI00224C9CCD|nr:MULTISPECIES: tetratricopeptide repeat protein [Paraburkholderia]MCX4163892.1 tetratricopeptide repeat protein [Paraburkholderia megapolitana]MDN7159387.1 tetratricopeptide repeat protein [Paraburkholderia sp. CHISQ3]MDQ6496434.1 tetratricopeptide repeat protein [Paraburkholderia megapolitana]
MNKIEATQHYLRNRSLRSAHPTRRQPRSVPLYIALAFLFAMGFPRTLLAVPIDIDQLWNWNSPAQSEERFRSALAGADANQAFILQTQIARTYGLRGNSAQARQILEDLKPKLAHVSPEARVRYHLERGRTFASAVSTEGGPSREMQREARNEYSEAFRLASEQHLDDLAVDALHMMAFVDKAPADQLRLDDRALAIAMNSSDPKAQKWEASLRNNIGGALNDLGRSTEALEQFRIALALRTRAGGAESTRQAWCSVGWTLRLLGRNNEALAIQQQLLTEYDAIGTTNPDVLDELREIYHAMGDEQKAAVYASRLQAYQATHPDSSP